MHPTPSSESTAPRSRSSTPGETKRLLVQFVALLADPRAKNVLNYLVASLLGSPRSFSRRSSTRHQAHGALPLFLPTPPPAWPLPFLRHLVEPHIHDPRNRGGLNISLWHRRARDSARGTIQYPPSGTNVQEDGPDERGLCAFK